jgi:hypothetical protein
MDKEPFARTFLWTNFEFLNVHATRVAGVRGLDRRNGLLPNNVSHLPQQEQLGFAFFLFTSLTDLNESYLQL